MPEDVTNLITAVAKAQPDPYAGTSGRVIRPSQGVLLDDKHFQLENVDELARALLERTEGRLETLRRAALEIEERIRVRVEKSRTSIQRALEVAKHSIDEAKHNVEHEIETRAAEAAVERERKREAGVEEGRKRGFETGYEEGLAKGLLEGRAAGEQAVRAEMETRFTADITSAAAALRELLSALDAQRAGLFTSARAELLALALGVARKVIRHEVREVPEVIRGTLAAAIDRIADRHKIAIEINPEDRAIVAAYLEETAAALQGSEAVQIIERADLARGGCIVRGGTGGVDVSLETQLELLEKRLVQVGEVAQ